MTDLEAIKLRHSRRSYLETPIDKDKIAVLLSVINRCNKESGLSIQFIEQGREAFRGFTASYGLFSKVQSYIAIVGSNSDIYRREKAGYYGEKLVLTATKLDLGTCWVGGSFKRSRTACVIGEDESLIILITIGNIGEQKGFKENTIYKLMHLGTKPVEKLYSSDTDVPDWFIGGMNAVLRAPSAINRKPVLFRYQNGNVTAEVSDYDNYEATDLGIAKLHFEIGAGRGKFEPGNGAKLAL